MTSEEIRREPPKLDKRDSIFWLREIAAQLAELNEYRRCKDAVAKKRVEEEIEFRRAYGGGV